MYNISFLNQNNEHGTRRFVYCLEKVYNFTYFNTLEKSLPAVVIYMKVYHKKEDPPPILYRHI